MSDELRKLAEAATPDAPGGFIGDIWFGDAENRTLGTHRWDGNEWHELPAETGSLLELLTKARAELTALRAKVKSQAEALAPFAEAAEWWSDLAVGFNRPNSEKLWEVPTSIKGCGLTVGDLRRAQEATDE